jgi:EpsD family peptidyl-prolyl cis-trans isomerase
MKRLAGFMIIICFFLVFSACANKEGGKGPYLAKVGSAVITQADFEREFKNLPQFAQTLFQGSGGKERFLDELIKKEMLYQEALKKGLDKDPQYLAKVEDFKKLTLVSMLLEKEIGTKGKVTEQDAKDYYDKHKEDFAAVSQIKLSQILVRTEDEANKIMASLKNGEDFAKLAREKSIDTRTAKNGGDVGFVSKGQLMPEIEAVAARLKIGEVSEPIKTKAGYEIIKVTDKKFGKPIEFDKVQRVIMQRLAAEQQKDAFDSYMDQLKKSYKVEINKEALAKLSGGEEQKEGLQENPAQSGETKEAPPKTTEQKRKKD